MANLKVFLRYSPRSSRNNALGIYNAIKHLGHTHISDFVEKVQSEVFYTEDENAWGMRYVKSVKELDSADVCVFETSIPSTAMGQLAQLAVSKFKPTILLHLKDQKPYFFRGLAETEKRVQLLEYNPENVEELLRYAFKEAQEFLNTRFTLIFTPEIMAHLDKIKRMGKSRSEYIRKLILKDIKDENIF